MIDKIVENTMSGKEVDGRFINPVFCCNSENFPNMPVGKVFKHLGYDVYTHDLIDTDRFLVVDKQYIIEK